MKRSLAVFGLSYLLIQLLAILLPPTVFYPAAAVFASLTFLALIFHKKHSLFGKIAFVFSIFAIAFAFRGIYISLYFQPVVLLENTTAQISGTVCEVKPLYSGIVQVVVKVNNKDNANISAFKTQFESITDVKYGDKVRLNVEFSKLENNEYKLQNYAKGIFIAAKPISEVEIIGEEKSIFTLFNGVQTYLSSNITSVMHSDEGKIAAAMAVGDKSFLTSSIKYRFRCAGISHLLVVSGMHLTIAGGAIFFIFSHLFCNIKFGAGFAAVSTLLFMLLTGITPSVIRAGLTMLIVYFGILFDKTPDTITSIGMAALILCLQNPFAAVDLGLLLSFTATIGVLLSTFVVKNINAESNLRNNKFIFKAIEIISVPLFATMATMPVLMAFGGAISIYSIPFNIITVPILPFIAISAFAIGILGSVPFLGFAVNIIGFVCRIAVGYVDFLAKQAEKLPYSQLYLNKTSLLIAILLLYFLIYIGYKFKIKLAFLYCTGFVILCVAIQYMYTKDLIYVNAFKLNSDAAVIITQNRKSVCVLNGNLSNANFAKRHLEENNIFVVTDFVDIRRSEHDATFLDVLECEDYYNIESTVVNSAVIPVLENSKIYINRQKEGITACIDLSGFKIVIDSGKVNHINYAPVDIFVAGRNEPQNIKTQKIWCIEKIPRWLDINTNNIIYPQAVEGLIVRPNKSVMEVKKAYDY